MRKAILGALMMAPFIACDSDFSHVDHDGLYVEVLTAQPTSSDLGRLIRVFARGGSSIQVSIEGGTLHSGAECAADASDVACTCFRAKSELALSVRPASSEALLTISLHEGDSCQVDSVLSQKQIAISRPGENESDAGVADGPTATMNGEGL